MGAGAQALGVLQPTSRGVPPPTFGVCCWRAPGAPGPGSGQLPFGSEAANEEGAAGRGAGRADPPGSHTQLCWGVNRVLLWTCLHGALGLQGVVSTPGASNSRDSRHTRLPHGWLSARSVPAKSSHLSRPRSPASPLSKPQVQQVSPDAPRLRLCPQRPQTLPHPLTPRGPGPPHLLLPGFQGPLGSAPVPAPPPPGSSPSLRTCCSLNTCVPRPSSPPSRKHHLLPQCRHGQALNRDLTREASDDSGYLRALTMRRAGF